MPKKPPENRRDSLADEVDALLKKLPGADPSLGGDPDAPRPAAAGLGVPGGVRPQRPAPTRPRSDGPTTRQKAGTWAMLGAGVVLGVALLQWPYASACGVSLFGYLLSVVTLIVVAGWVFITSWFYRMGLVHTAALILAFWGIVLAAEQVLPRIGYAEEEATWFCSEEEQAPVPPAPAVLPAAVDSTALAGDSAALVGDSAGALPDSAAPMRDSAGATPDSVPR